MTGYIPVGDPERKRETDRLSKRRTRSGTVRAVILVARPPVFLPVAPAVTGIDPDWRDRARCKNTDPRVMDGETAEDEREARALCSRCPVFRECDVFADRTDATWGVWAGVNRSGTREAAAS